MAKKKVPLNFEDVFAKSVAIHSAPKNAKEYMGIVRSSYPDWRGWQQIDGLTAQGLPIENTLLQGYAFEFYQKYFWDELRLAELKDDGLACDAFDVAVKYGRQIAARMLHQAFNLLEEIGITERVETSNLLLGCLNEHKFPEKLRDTFIVLAASRFIAEPEFYRKWAFK